MTESNEEHGWPLFEVWKEYEQIAMHFNDLLLKLRIQALAGVAAVSTLIGILSENGLDKLSWEVSAFAFLVLIAFWTAILVLDSYYYNRLLIGAANALFEIEEISKEKMQVSKLELSTKLNLSVGSGKLTRDISWNQRRGRVWFYTLVLIVLVGGMGYSLWRVWCENQI